MGIFLVIIATIPEEVCEYQLVVRQFLLAISLHILQSAMKPDMAAYRARGTRRRAKVLVKKQPPVASESRMR